jgi:hypothetical protein
MKTLRGRLELSAGITVCSMSERNIDRGSMMITSSLLKKPVILYGFLLIALNTAGSCVAAPARVAEKNDLTIEFTQTGGFMATHKRAFVVESSLSKDEAKTLRKSVSKSGLPKVTELKKLNPAAADVFYYDFVLKEKGRTHHATFDDTTLPQSYVALRDFMSARAKSVPLSK